ncbi:MAG: hypothetical protein JW873_06250 [Candidatus Saganbacteria bacterium]|nr:hypothetical protein [Candidatus Saganbacteria bacterium]
MKLTCPICEFNFEVPDSTKPKARITCPNCFAQLALHDHKGKKVLACAICKNPIFDPAECGDCERRREKRTILEEGKL